MPPLMSYSKEAMADLLVERIRRSGERVDALEAFLRSFLNPEERGLAVAAHVRDDVREILGMPRVESPQPCARCGHWPYECLCVQREETP